MRRLLAGTLTIVVLLLLGVERCNPGTATALNDDVKTSSLVGSWIVTSTDPHGSEFLRSHRSTRRDSDRNGQRANQCMGVGHSQRRHAEFTYVSIDRTGHWRVAPSMSPCIVVGADGNS